MKLTPELLSAILNVAGPIVLGAITQHHADTGQIPTEAELRAKLNLNIDTYLAEGQAWTDSHRPNG